MKMSKQVYGEYVRKMSPNSPMGKDLFHAFWVGGMICVVGQAITNGFTAMGLEKTDAATATSITLVVLSALFTGLSFYDNLAKYAGAGTLVPITGFANAVVSPAIEFRAENWINGVASKMFIIAGPVIVYGTVASVVYGVIDWLYMTI